MVLLILAHPYPDRSRANKLLLDNVRDLDGLEVRSLYELYPDYAIDVPEEQRALTRATAVVWQHPLYWYSVPSLMKLWLDKVLVQGFAYGEGGTFLHGKPCLWTVTTGGRQEMYAPEGVHAYPFETFVTPVEQIARFCGLVWQKPLVLHGAHSVATTEIERVGLEYRERLLALGARPGEDLHV